MTCYKQHAPPLSFTASSSLLRIQSVENVHFLQIFRSGKTADKKEKEKDQQDVYEDAEDGDAEDGDEEEGEGEEQFEDEEEVGEDEGLEEQGFSETPVSGQNGTEVSA